MSDPGANERFDKLEAHIAHLERTVDELNQVVIEQARTLRHLQTNQMRLGSTMESLELDRIRSSNARPPHYGR